MDLLNSLSVPQRPEGLSPSARKETKDVPVEGSSDLSFSGILEQNQERSLPVKQGAQKGGQLGPQTPTLFAGEQTQTGDPVATIQASVAVTLPIFSELAGTADPALTGMMTKLPTAQNSPAQNSPAPDSSKISRQVIPQVSVPAPKPAAAAEKLLADIRPTGRADLATPKLMLAGLQKTVADDQAIKTPPTIQAALPVKPGAPVPTLEVPPVQGTDASPENQLKDQPLKGLESATRPSLAPTPQDQNPAKLETKSPASAILGNHSSQKPVPQVLTTTLDNGGKGEETLADFRKMPVEIPPSGQEGGENPEKATAHPEPSPQVLSQPTEISTGETAVDNSEDAWSSELAVGSGPAKSVVTNSNTTSRTALLEQGRQIRQQVMREISSGLGSRIGNEKITLQLNPEGLGQVEIQISTNRNDLNIVITASSTEAEQALREGVKELAEGIADKSARWQQVDIKVDQRGQDQEKNESRQENRRDQSRREERQNQQQGKRDRQQDGTPDWASLQEEG